MRTRALAAAFIAAGALGAVPATALAGGTSSGVLPSATATTPTTPVVPASTSTQTVTAVKGKASLTFSGTFDVKHLKVTVPGRDVHVSGDVTPYRPGQRVTIEALEGGRVFAKKTQYLIASPKKVYGAFSATFRAPRAGEVAIKVIHLKSRGMFAFTAEKAYKVLGENVGVGATGRLVDLVQNRLRALHIYIPQTGVFDYGTQLALDTYHRLLGEGEGHTQLDSATIKALLNGQGAFNIKFPRQGGATQMHAEGDLTIQVLAYIRDDKVVWLLPISSGKPSTPTILGNYQVYRKQPEYTSDGMYFSNFFTGGYAIHGYNPAPDFPASHGCMRLNMVDAIFAYNLLNIGDWVDTYYT
jgi:hypothetical protein